MNLANKTKQELIEIIRRYEADDKRKHEINRTIKKQRDYLESIFNNTDTAIFIIDVDAKGDFRFNSLNPAHEEISGFKNEEIKGKTPEELVPDLLTLDAAKAVKANYQKCYDARELIRYEEMIPMKGRDIYWLTTLTPLFNEKGDIYRIIGSASEVTQLKISEKTLREYKENLEKIVTERTIKLEKRNEDLQKEIRERAAIEEELRATNEKLSEEIEQRVKAEMQLKEELEQRAVIDEELRATNEELTHEIENRQKVQNELEHSEKKWHTLYNEAPDMYISVSPKDGSIIECNKTLLNKTGYKREEIIGKRIFDMYHEDCLHLVKENFKYFKTKGRIIHNELKAKKKNGKLLDVSLILNVIRNNKGKILYSVSSWRDITEIKKAQKEIVRQKQFNDYIINALPGIYYMFDSNGKLIRWNNNFMKVTGYSAEEMVKKTPVDFFTGKDKQLISKRVKLVFEKGESYANANLTTKDNQKIPYYFTGIRITLDNQTFMVGTGTDLTEIKKAQQALLESENRYHLALEAADEGIWDWHPGNPEVYYSDRWKAQVGYEPYELENSFDTWEALLHPDDYDRMHQEVADYLKNPKGKFIAEFRMRHKNGSYRWIRNISTSYKDENGNVKRLVGAHSDITEQKKITEVLMQSEEQHRMVFESVTDSLIICNLIGEIIEVNPAATKLYGYSKEEFLKIKPFDLVHPDYHHVLNEFLSTVKEGKTFRGETIDIKKDQTQMNVEIIGTQLIFRGKPHIMAIIRDITQRKKDEEQLNQTLSELEESNKELEQFAYIASHDLQEPLRMVSSFLQLLVKRYENQFDETAMEFIGFAVDGANRMKQLIKDLLQFSRVGTRGKPFELKNLNTEIDKVINTLKELIETNNAEIIVGKLPDLYVDDTQIMQLFQNLISNAIKFKGEKDPKITISAKKKRKFYEFTVKDNGIGFEEKYAERIFVIFQRLHTKEEYEGTGIGLAVCKKIVERHGGKMWVKSEPGKGSSFQFTLPAG